VISQHPWAVRDRWYLSRDPARRRCLSAAVHDRRGRHHRRRRPPHPGHPMGSRRLLRGTDRLRG